MALPVFVGDPAVSKKRKRLGTHVVALGATVAAATAVASPANVMVTPVSRARSKVGAMWTRTVGGGKRKQTVK
jgi:di/tricarboxylate transporter